MFLVFGSAESETKKIQIESVPDGISIKWDSLSGFKKNIVIRGESGIPKGVDDGKIVYEGNDNSFIDRDIKGKKKYYYTVFSVRDKTYVEKVESVVKKTLETYERIPVTVKAGVVVIGSSSQILWIFGVFNSFKGFWLTLLRIFQTAVAFLAMRKKNKWGLVYDWENKQPLKNVMLNILDEDGKKIESTITDETGRFGFLVGKGKFTIQPAGGKKYSFKPDDYNAKDLYGKVYKGEEIAVEEEGVLRLNIPLTGPGKEAASPKRFGLSRIRSVKVVSVILEVSFWLSLIFIILSMMKSVTVLNISVLSLYIFIILLRLYVFRLAREWGLVVSSLNNNSLPFAVVRAFSGSDENKKQVGVSVTNTKGSFYLLVPPETKSVSIKGRTLEGDNFKKDLPVNPKKGLLNGIYKV